MIDIDPSEYCDIKYSVKGVLKLLGNLIPGFNDCAKVVKQSSSSYINEELKGFHIYIPIKNTQDSHRFLNQLYNHLWLNGHGYLALSKDGKILERSTVDVCTASPERIDFVAPPITDLPTFKHINGKAVDYIPGNYLDTFLLKDADPKAVKTAINKARTDGRILKKQKAKQEEYDHNRVLKLVEQGYSAIKATEIVARDRKNEYKLLSPEHLLYFDDGSVAPFNDYQLHVGKWLKDPINNDEYGKAQLILSHGIPTIRSFANGGRTYQLLVIHANTIYTLNTIPGTRKTTAALNLIARRFRSGCRQIISVLTLPLMDQYITNLKKVGLRDDDIEVIHARTYDYKDCDWKNSIMSRYCNVAEQINISTRNCCKLILITHEGLLNYGQSIKGYSLIIDEVFNPYSVSSHSLKDSISDQGILRKYLTFYEQPNGCWLLKPKNGQRKLIESYLRQVDSTESVDISGNQYILKACMSRQYKCYLMPMDSRSSNSHAFLIVFEDKYLSHFKSVILISALVEHTALYHLLKKSYNIEDASHKFDEIVTLSHRLKRLKLIPFVEHYTKYQRNCSNIRHKKKILSFNQAVNKIIEVCSYFDENTLRITNKDMVNTYKKVQGEYIGSVLRDTGEDLLGKHLGPILHGLNNWQDHTSAIVDAAFNCDPQTICAVRKLLPDYDQWLENTVLALIQIFMRTALRDYESDDEVYVMLPDRRACEKVCELLGLKTLQIIDHCLSAEFELA